MLHCWILLLLSTVYVQAQGRFSRAILDSPWTVGKPFRIHFTWEGEEKWGSLHLPISKSLQIIDSDFNAPARIDAVNKEIKKSWSKYYTVKSPVSGAITLPSAHITLGGKIYSIAPQKIYIQKTTVPTSQAASPTGEPFMLEENTFLLPGESPERKTPELVFIRIETNKRFCYIGENLLVTYKLYTSVDSRSEVLKRPSFNGFSVLDVLKTYDAEPVAEWLNGKAYYTHIIRKVHLFPLREGDLSLDEAIIQTSIEYKENKHRTNSTSRGNTESIVSIPYTTTIHSAPHKVTVKALPSHTESKNVNGAVGHFSLELSTDKPVYATGEQGVLRLHIYGEGNWPLIGIPEIQWPSSLKHMEPEITESYDPHSYPLRGEKAFIHRFVAQDTGQWSVPPIHMVYFDPQSSKYITIRSKPLPIKVTLKSGNSTERSGSPNAENTSTQGNSMVILYFSILLLAILGRIVYMVMKKNSPEKEEVGRP